MKTEIRFVQLLVADRRAAVSYTLRNDDGSEFTSDVADVALSDAAWSMVVDEVGKNLSSDVAAVLAEKANATPTIVKDALLAKAQALEDEHNARRRAVEHELRASDLAAKLELAQQAAEGLTAQLEAKNASIALADLQLITKQADAEALAKREAEEVAQRNAERRAAEDALAMALAEAAKVKSEADAVLAQKRAEASALDARIAAKHAALAETAAPETKPEGVTP